MHPHPQRAEDPADVVVAWEAVEDLLAVVPEGTGKLVLRLTAAGWAVTEIAAQLGITADDVRVHAARARVRVLTAAVAIPPDGRPAPHEGSR
jgi:DNA-directed RNA polymerase specialized sigma24 family protein